MWNTTYATVSCGNSIPLLFPLKPHTVVGKCHMRSDEDEIYSAICAEWYVERSSPYQMQK
jgi:hypothetical protein